MLSFTKFFGTLVIFFGLLLLMTCYERIDFTVLETIVLAITGLLICSMGAVCWLWYEPIDSDDED